MPYTGPSNWLVGIGSGLSELSRQLAGIQERNLQEKKYKEAMDRDEARYREGIEREDQYRKEQTDWRNLQAAVASVERLGPGAQIDSETQQMLQQSPYRTMLAPTPSITDLSTGKPAADGSQFIAKLPSQLLDDLNLKVVTPGTRAWTSEDYRHDASERRANETMRLQQQSAQLQREQADLTIAAQQRQRDLLNDPSLGGKINIPGIGPITASMAVELGIYDKYLQYVVAKQSADQARQQALSDREASNAAAAYSRHVDDYIKSRAYVYDSIPDPLSFREDPAKIQEAIKLRLEIAARIQNEAHNYAAARIREQFPDVSGRYPASADPDAELKTVYNNWQTLKNNPQVLETNPQLAEFSKVLAGTLTAEVDAATKLTRLQDLQADTEKIQPRTPDVNMALGVLAYIIPRTEVWASAMGLPPHLAPVEPVQPAPTTPAKRGWSWFKPPSSDAPPPAPIIKR